MNPLAKRPGEESHWWLVATDTRSLAAEPAKVLTFAGSDGVGDIKGTDPTYSVKVDDGVPFEGLGWSGSEPTEALAVDTTPPPATVKAP